ncbi:MAG: ferritin-like domain-containing protein [Candidatus Pacebacteria bacterium]|nr:ferritin-like domain-containing protein [Candidatus Paceibacterota bacterium]
MNEEQKNMYLAWLRDAHAMEMGLITTLEKQVAETEDKPDIQARLKDHLQETRSHATKVEGCLKRHKTDASGGKDILMQMANAAKGVMASLPHDSLVKNAMASYAAEHFEIASYTAIIAAAEALDDTETASVCADILKDEIDMANWLAEQLPDIVQEHIREMDLVEA